MTVFLAIVKWVLIVAAALFVLTLILYFFNLDMKLASKMQPVMNKLYDRVKRRPLP